MEPVALQVPRAGSYTSAVTSPPYPPATRTFPSARSVAVGKERGRDMEPVKAQPAQAGSPVTPKERVADSPWALVTMAMMEAGPVGGAQAGAVQLTRLVLAVLWAAPGVTATLLPNGTVLVAGGVGAAPPWRRPCCTIRPRVPGPRPAPWPLLATGTRRPCSPAERCWSRAAGRTLLFSRQQSCTIQPRELGPPRVPWPPLAGGTQRPC